MKKMASVYRHGNRYSVGAMAFFESSPGATSSTIATVVGDDEEPSDGDLGGAVIEMLERSGVLDLSLVARGESGRSIDAANLSLPSDAVLESEAVTVTVFQRNGQLTIRPMRTLGPGGGFGGSGFEPTRIPADSDPATVGAAVREATLAAREASGDVIVPAGTWRGGQPPVEGLPISGVVTARRIDGRWVVTTRSGARGGGETGQPSSVQHGLPETATIGDLGRVVIDGMRADVERDAGGGESTQIGVGQVLIEGDDGQLVIYPQEIDPGTGQWDTPAHSDVRTVFPGATAEQVGQAIQLTLEAQDLP